jgi:hypothetical protein
MPTVEHVFFASVHNAKVLSVLFLNSAYYQISLPAERRKATAVCRSSGLFEFTKLRMGICVGCQPLCRMVDSLFGDIKRRYVYKFMDDLIIHSKTFEKHV